MFFCIDAGNSRTKAAVYNAEGHLIESIVTAENDFDSIATFVDRLNPQHMIVSTTGTRDWSINELPISGIKIELSDKTPLPISILYATPETLGRDRIAASCGAKALYPDKNCMVVSAGTCLTMDILLGTGVFVGGNIAPGLKMRFQAMHEHTANLPLAMPGWPETAYGDTTEHALQNGACLGMVMEIEGIFHRAKNAFGEVLIVISGGDAAFLAEQIKSQIFVAPELVTQGLFQILAFNVQQHQ